MAGRGAGKTRAAAEWLAFQSIRTPGTRWAVAAPTFTDARDTCAEGESGLVGIIRQYGMLKDYNRSIGEIFLTNRSRIKLFSGEEPDRFRGPQFHGGWFDELAAFKYPETWDQYQFGLRLGKHPQTVVTTTPRPTKFVKDLLVREGVIVSRGSTFDNAKNLAPSALAELRARYEGTRLGRQELFGEIVDDNEGALWTRNMIEQSRVTDAASMFRIVVAIDPAVTNNEESDETGIIVAGIAASGHYYVLEDLSCKASPDAWARKAVDAYKRWKADRIVGEANNGGDMIESLIRTVDPTTAYKKVTATRGKKLRAEPIAALYEQGRVHHVTGFPQLEDQMCGWTPDSNDSPDRMDAMVWALTELSENITAAVSLAALGIICPKCHHPNTRNAITCTKCGSMLAVQSTNTV